VDRLIEALDYNEAINLLVEIVKENPEEMEKAQKLIQSIREKKEEFNKKYQELITALFEENDYEKGLEIIDELEELDKNPNPATEDTIRDARISAELIYYRLLFNDIMDRALAELEQNRYDEAVRLYLTGFTLHKRTYDERDYGDLIKGPVDSSLEELLQSGNSFIEDYGSLSGFASSELTAETAESEAAVDRVVETFREFSELRNAVWHAGWVFENQNRLLEEISTEYEEDFFLSFAQRIVYGRLGTETDEGLIYAMDTYWNRELRPLAEGIGNKRESILSRADQAYNRKDWEESERLFEETAYWTEQSLKLLALRTDLLNLQENLALHEDSSTILEQFYNERPTLLAEKNRAEWFVRLSQYNQRLINYNIYNNQDPPLMAARRTILGEETDTLRPGLDEWETERERADRDILYTAEDVNRISSRTILSINSVLSEYSLLSGRLALDMAEYGIVPLEERYAGLITDRDQALSLLEGIPPETAEEEDRSILFVYPRRTLERLKTLEEENTLLADQVRSFRTLNLNLQDEIPQKEEMGDYISRADTLLDGLRLDQAEYTRLSRKSDQNISFAERYLNEGEFRFSQSEAALNRKDFPQAIQELTTAQDLFVQALSYDEDIISREEADRRIEALQQRILQEENREVVRYVRENVNRGKNLYLQGLYAQSEVILLRAENRWYTTNTDPNSEISYWLNLVRAALSVESGRTIEDTEPLYAEMTQFLNLAQANFETGEDLIRRGNVTDGLKFLDKADQNLNEILIPMPLNQEASVLKLRIQQLRDPDLFAVTFAEKYKGAVGKLRTEPDIAYIELKDLAEIQPAYPGIGRAIYDAEIILGIRVPPPDPRALRESTELYGKAFEIVEGNVRSQFPVALKQLDRAIELNPENQKAIELKDRIQLDAGGQTTIVLSSAAQAQFNIAEEKYINGEYFEAYAIVQQLLKDRDNAAYPPLQDLRRRIESKF